MLAPNLYNFVSGTTIPSAVTKLLFKGREQYEIFQTERFLDHSKTRHTKLLSQSQ